MWGRVGAFVSGGIRRKASRKGVSMTTNISSRQDSRPLNGMAPIVGASQELVDVLQNIVRNAGALLDVDNCSVALLDAGGSSLVTLAALQKQGRRPRHTRFQQNEGVAGWVAEHREPLIINDVSLDPRFKRLGRAPIGSMVCVPLFDKEEFIGTLTASSPEKVAFDGRKLRMLTIFSEQAVLAFVNARQAETAQHQADQLEMLISLSQGITTRLEADDLYRTILLNVRRLVSAQRVIIYHYQQHSQLLRPVAEISDEDGAACQQEACAASVKIGESQGESININHATSLVAWAALHRHPMLRAPGAGADVETQFIAPTEDEDVLETGATAAKMAIPLVSKETLYGVLVLQRSVAFSSEELRLMRNLGNMAAAALENVELFYRVRADQEQWRAIWSASSDGIALLGVDACFIEANPAFGQIFGIDPQQVAGMECLELFVCEDEGGHEACRELCMIHRALQEERALPYMEIDLSIKGVSRSIGLSITPVLLANMPFCMVMARDMTVIRDLMRMKANFLSMITHELRSPINSINGYLDLALTGIAGDLNEQQREFVRRARGGSEHLYALVEDLLLVSRADSGQLRLNRSIIGLQELIANSIEELELTASDNGITISAAIPTDFPRVYADGTRIQQVLRNLISNALRFTPSGGNVTLSASVVEDANTPFDGEVSETSKSFAVQVRDTGSGIAPEYQERIFERFYQIPLDHSGRTSGQGLGLAIVKMIVELHGGQVIVESAPGTGSAFTFTIPGILS
jgi:PAS domain S-box-containing protein